MPDEAGTLSIEEAMALRSAYQRAQEAVEQEHAKRLLEAQQRLTGCHEI